MGAGKGRARRARVDVMEKNGVKFDTDLWYRFLEEQGISDETIGSYYGVKVQAGSESGDVERAAGELFADLTEIGIVELPDGFQEGDVTFLMKERLRGLPVLSQNVLVMQHVPTGIEQEVGVSPGDYFSVGSELRSLGTMSIIASIMEATSGLSKRLGRDV